MKFKFHQFIVESEREGKSDVGDNRNNKKGTWMEMRKISCFSLNQLLDLKKGKTSEKNLNILIKHDLNFYHFGERERERNDKL